MMTFSAIGILTEIIKELPRVKAADKEKAAAASIGTAAHALIEWQTRTMMGQDPGPELTVPDAALWAVEVWKEWAASVDFTPIHIEQVVHCPECGYAGTVDFIAKVNGVVTLGDYKTGKAIYPEAFLQVNAYRHAADRCGMPTAQGVIIRLPKTVEDPKPEVMVVPNEECELPEAFRAAITLWRWKRTMEGKPTGTARG